MTTDLLKTVIALAKTDRKLSYKTMVVGWKSLSPNDRKVLESLFEKATKQPAEEMDQHELVRELWSLALEGKLKVPPAARKVMMEQVRSSTNAGRRSDEIKKRLAKPLGSMLKDRILTLQQYKQIEALIDSFRP